MSEIPIWWAVESMTRDGGYFQGKDVGDSEQMSTKSNLTPLGAVYGLSKTRVFFDCIVQ